MQNLISNVLTVIGYLLAAAIALVPISVLTARVLPIVDLFAQFLLAATVGSILLAAFALVIGRYGLASVSIVLLLTCVALAWPYERAPSAVEADRRIKLLSFNIFFDNKRLADVVTHVRQIDADLVVLLEVAPRNREGLRPLDQDYPYRLECWQKTRCDILILSRVPLKDLEPVLSIVNTPPAWAAAELELGGCRFSLVAAHLSLPFPFHTPGAQWARALSLTQIIEQIPHPKIVAGDFNAAPWGAIMSDIAGAGKLNILTGYGATWPTHLPTMLGIPIDHVLASPEVAFLSRELKSIPGSDHRGVLTEIALPLQSECGKSP